MPNTRFKTGVCGQIEGSNPGTEKCSSWTLQLRPDASKLNVQRLKVWNMEDIDDGTSGAMLYRSLKAHEVIPPGQKLKSRAPGACVYWNRGGPQFSDAQVDQLLGATIVCNK